MNNMLSKMTTYYDIIQQSFPNIVSLDVDSYTVEPYKSNTLRRCKLVIFLGALRNYPMLKISLNEQFELIKKIEQSCLNATIRKSREDNIQSSWQTDAFVQRYNNIVYERAWELDYSNNDKFIINVINGDIDPKNIGFLSPEEISTVKYLQLKERSEKRKNIKIQRKIVTCYKCPLCGENEATYQNLQLRGADEPKSTVITCEFCTHEWIDEY